MATYAPGFNPKPAAKPATQPTTKPTSNPWWGAGTESSLASMIAADLAGPSLSQFASQQEQNALANVQQNVLSPEQQALQQQVLGSNYGYQQQQYGVQGQQLGLSQQENIQQQQQLGKEYGFQQQQNVLSGQGIQAAIGNILKNYQNQMGQLGLSERGAMQDLGARGALLSGRGGAKSQTEQQFGLERQGLTTNMQYSIFQQQQAMKSLGLNEAQQKEQFGYSTQQLKNGYQAIGLQLKQLGISEAQAHDQYQNALSQLGLSNVMSVEQFGQELAAIAGGGYSPLLGQAGTLQKALPGIADFALAQGSGG